jgi:hypothetical protein
MGSMGHLLSLVVPSSKARLMPQWASFIKILKNQCFSIDLNDEDWTETDKET